MSDRSENEDPGWPTLGLILLMLLPGGIRLAARRRSDHGLVRLRAVFLAFSGSLVAFAVVLAFLQVPGGPVFPWLPEVVALAAGSVVAVRYLVKPLDCSSPAVLGASYRARLFLVIAFSQTVALFAFTCNFIGGPRWIYDVGAAFTLYRYWTAVPPTRAGIARDQERLTASGCTLSLLASLRDLPTTP